MVRETQNPAPRRWISFGSGLFSGWENRDRTRLMLRLMQRLGKPFFQFIRGSSFPGRRIFSGQSQTTQFRLTAFPVPSAAWREVLQLRRRQHRTHHPSSKPPKAGQGIARDCRYHCAMRGSRNTPLSMVTEGTLAIAQASRGVFLDDKCYSNKRTYEIKCFAQNGESQLFFRSIFKLTTISFRLSREETLRTGDFAPSNSACTS